jgi:hypothetical protein
MEYPAGKYLKTRANLLEKCAQNFWTVRPSKTVQVRTDCTDLLSQKFMPNRLLDFCANKCSVAALECVPTLSEIVVAVLLDFCAH